VKNLEAAGIKCEYIDRIIFTHGHIDHVGGSFDSRGRPVFPNARYMATAREWECWLTRPERSELQSMFLVPARKNLLPIPDQFDLVKDDAEILPGIKLVAAHGHTPGNVMVEISSEGQRLLCIGDIIHSQTEFVDPAYLSLFDIDPEQALKTRAQVLSDVAESGTLVFACHLPFPGLGHIMRHEGVFAWRPI
jgi:glyoxylase-like metal-dependent hydrolase (beta-lactamase superfamily II)